MNDDSSIDRRTFVKGVSSADRRRRYCIVSTGSRSGMYQQAIEVDYREHAQLVGVCDKNAGRMELARRKAKERGVEPPPAYSPDEFEKMIADNKPDAVI